MNIPADLKYPVERPARRVHYDHEHYIHAAKDIKAQIARLVQLVMQAV